MRGMGVNIPVTLVEVGGTASISVSVNQSLGAATADVV